MSALTQLIDLLLAHGEKNWSSMLAEVRDAIINGQKSALDSIAQTCQAGSGSLQDLYLHPANGDKISIDEVVEVNNQISALVTTVGQLTRTLRCDL